MNQLKDILLSEDYPSSIAKMSFWELQPNKITGLKLKVFHYQIKQKFGIDLANELILRISNHVHGLQSFVIEPQPMLYSDFKDKMQEFPYASQQCILFALTSGIDINVVKTMSRSALMALRHNLMISAYAYGIAKRFPTRLGCEYVFYKETLKGAEPIKHIDVEIKSVFGFGFSTLKKMMQSMIMIDSAKGAREIRQSFKRIKRAN